MAKKSKRPGTIYVSWHVSVGRCKQSGEWEIEASEWDGMTEEEKQAWLDENMSSEISNWVDAGYGEPEYREE